MRGRPRSKTKKLVNQDFINKKELKKKVEVKTMLIDKPMSYMEFKELDENFKELYINNLRDKYGVRTGDIAEMMGTDTQILSKYLNLHNLIRKGLPRMTSQQKKDWKEFCLGNTQDLPEVVTIPEEISLEDITIPKEEANIINIPKSNMVITDCTLKLRKSDMAEFIDMLSNIMVEDKEYTIHIQ